MNNWNVAVDNYSFERAGITKDCQDAVCEYIWNGFEAGASIVAVEIIEAELRESPEVRIIDNGSGIVYSSLRNTFGGFLSSQKRNMNIRIKSNINKGKGRFSYMAFSNMAKWSTVCLDGEKRLQYNLHLYAENKATVDESEITEVDSTIPCGTIVTIPIKDEYTSKMFTIRAMHKKLLSEFAWFLYLHKEKDFVLKYCGSIIDYSEYIDAELSQFQEIIIKSEVFSINIVVWKDTIENSSKTYYLASDGGISDAANTTFNKNAVGFYHAAFVTSSYFDKIPVLHNIDEETFIEFERGQREIMRELKKNIHSMIDSALRAYLIRRADKYLKDMEDKDYYPHFSDNDFGKAKKKDFESVTRELFCIEPKIFYKLKEKQTKSLLGFLALLLDSNERENLLVVIDEIVSLTHEQREKFAKVLKRSKLAHIIDLIDIVQQRFHVIKELQEIIYNMKDYANERDHIQKIIENHYWLFGDQYHMASADVQMQRALEEYEKLIDSENTQKSTISEEDKKKRMDIFLYAGRKNENGNKENLIIELKAPSIDLKPKVLNQIKEYANIIRKEPRFLSQERRWKFFAVCSTIHEDVKVEFKNYETKGKLGLASILDNFEIYALTWDDIFTSFELRYDFLLENLRQDFEGTIDVEQDGIASREYVNQKVQSLIDLQLVRTNAN